MEKNNTQTKRIRVRFGTAWARNHQVVKKAFVLLMISVVWISVAAQWDCLRMKPAIGGYGVWTVASTLVISKRIRL